MENSLMLAVLILLLSLFLHEYINKPVWTICETEKCPYCYGTSFCESIQMNTVNLNNGNLNDIFTNYLSVKNVFKGTYRNESIYLKKLGHNFELDKLDDEICLSNGLNKNCFINNELIDTQNYQQKILNLLNQDFNTINDEKVSYFKSCNEETSTLILNNLLELNSIVAKDLYLKNLWTILKMNAEPLILQLLSNDDFPIPHYYGACGRVIAVKNSGEMLHSLPQNYNWFDRVYIALQIIKAAQDFTEKHPLFRFYLTDISPDNIVVDKKKKVRFIDLENVIIKSKSKQGHDEEIHAHQSAEITNKEYSYEEKAICKSTISDHNYLAVCKLILSPKAPYPLSGGILKGAPPFIRNKYSNLFESIKLCESPVKGTNRFQAANKIIETLQNILKENPHEM